MLNFGSVVFGDRFQGDLYDHGSLVKAIKQVDVVISTVGHGQLADQGKIIAAIKEAGNVKVKVSIFILVFSVFVSCVRVFCAAIVNVSLGVRGFSHLSLETTWIEFMLLSQQKLHLQPRPNFAELLRLRGSLTPMWPPTSLLATSCPL